MVGHPTHKKEAGQEKASKEEEIDHQTGPISTGPVFLLR
jgi:hypothetical protein